VPGDPIGAAASALKERIQATETLRTRARVDEAPDRASRRPQGIAVDAYALVAFLADEPARAEVTELLHGQSVISTVNLAESLDVLTRAHDRRRP
jgi:hypothetical protein